VDALSVKEGRLRALFEAGLAVSSELSLDGLLHRLAQAAAELTGARYAALGVIDASGSELERFITHGIDADTRAEIGSVPRGRGVLGVLIREAKPLRLRDLGEDPRSVGFPPGHPPMRTFLGVPVMLRGVAYGNLYLTEKEGGEDFTEEDEELLTLLAGQAAVAIENARLYEAATRWSRQLLSLQEVGNALATETDLEQLLDLVVRRLRDLLDARVVALALPAGGDELRFAAVAGAGTEDLLGTTISRSKSKSGAVLKRGRSERIDSVLDDPEVHQEVSRQLGARTGMWVPLIARDEAIGVLEIHDKEGSDPRFNHDDFRLAETFAARAAVAVELSQRVARDTVRRVVQAQELERRRLARELHDETGQALTSILLGLKPLEESADGPARAALSELREHVVSALQDVRRLAVELRPAVLDDFGLIPALERLTDSFSEQDVRVDFHSALGGMRLPGEVETTLYRVVQESLTNIVKHAHAHKVSVSVVRRESGVAAVIEDDGAGFDERTVRAEGIGLIGMRERLALLDGRLEVESRPGAGTTIVAEVPLQ
jgi:two-component system, NarL family, sensor histidine kinase DevS